MKNRIKTRTVSTKQLCQMFRDLANDFAEVQEKALVAMYGNTFEIHLEGGSINITINEEGGPR